jgi:hypothetical protein
MLLPFVGMTTSWSSSLSSSWHVIVCEIVKVSNGIYIIYIFERRLNQVHVVYITAPQSPKTPSKPTSFDVGLEPEWTSVLEGGSLASSWQAWRRKGGKNLPDSECETQRE